MSSLSIRKGTVQSREPAGERASELQGYPAS